jgi:putative intracellular protease/amidase
VIALICSALTLRQEIYNIMSQNLSSKRLVYVLIAPGFEEQLTIAVVEYLRDAGAEVRLIGITPGAMAGYHGITIAPDLTFNELSAETPSMLIFPGGRRSTARLLIDPRLHRLADNTTAHGGYVVGISDAYDALASTLSMTDQTRSQLVRLDSAPVPQYAQTLLNLLHSPHCSQETIA